MKFKYTIAFLFGFISCAFIFFLIGFSGLNVPFGTGLAVSDINAPRDWVSDNDIIVLDDRVILKISNATLSNYADGGSMRPIFDKGANGIRIVPRSASEIDVGDIISYRLGDVLVVHRVVEKGVDGNGAYFITRGDNSIMNDEKIRFEDIEYVTIGVIW